MNVNDPNHHTQHIQHMLMLDSYGFKPSHSSCPYSTAYSLIQRVYPQWCIYPIQDGWRDEDTTDRRIRRSPPPIGRMAVWPRRRALVSQIVHVARTDRRTRSCHPFIGGTWRRECFSHPGSKCDFGVGWHGLSLQTDTLSSLSSD